MLLRRLQLYGILGVFEYASSEAEFLLDVPVRMAVASRGPVADPGGLRWLDRCVTLTAARVEREIGSGRRSAYLRCAWTGDV